MKHLFAGNSDLNAIIAGIFFALALPLLAHAQTKRADFNGDGFDDLAIGIPNASVSGASGAGAVQIIYGSAAGLTSAGNRLISQSTSGVPGGSETNDHFGATLAAGDFNRDGFDELVVGTPFEDFASGLFDDINAGAFTVLPGSSSGVTGAGGVMRSSADIRFYSRGDDEYYGAGLAVGDLTRDGTDDLAVSAGGVQLESFYTGLTGSAFPTSDTATYANTGLTFAIGDFNGDNFGDVAYGNPSSAGSILVIHSKSGNSIFVVPSGSLTLFDTTVVTGDHFSASMVACDFDDDGFSDLAVGVPDKDDGSKTNSGAVSIYFGRSEASGTVDVLPVRRLVSTGSSSSTTTTAAGDRYGTSVAAGDVNGDGFCDLVIGAPGRDTDGLADSGSAWVVYGSADRFGSSATVQEVNQNTRFTIKGANIPGVAAAGDRYGSSVATGDFNADGYADVVVGVPGDDAGVAYGAVNVIYGAPSGLVVTGSQLWQQGSGGLPGSTQSGASFGSALQGSASQTPLTPGLSGFWSKERVGCRRSSRRTRCNAKAKLRVFNPGALRTESSSVKVYRSADDVLSSDDELLTTRSLRRLKPGQSIEFNIRSIGAADSIVGSTFIAVLDPDNVVPEADEENNTVISSALR